MDVEWKHKTAPDILKDMNDALELVSNGFIMKVDPCKIITAPPRLAFCSECGKEKLCFIHDRHNLCACEECLNKTIKDGKDGY